MDDEKKHKLCYCFSLCFRLNVAVSVSVSEDLFLMQNKLSEILLATKRLDFFGLFLVPASVRASRSHISPRSVPIDRSMSLSWLRDLTKAPEWIPILD